MIGEFPLLAVLSSKRFVYYSSKPRLSSGSSGSVCNKGFQQQQNSLYIDKFIMCSFTLYLTAVTLVSMMNTYQPTNITSYVIERKKRS